MQGICCEKLSFSVFLQVELTCYNVPNLPLRIMPFSVFFSLYAKPSFLPVAFSLLILLSQQKAPNIKGFPKIIKTFLFVCLFHKNMFVRDVVWQWQVVKHHVIPILKSSLNLGKGSNCMLWINENYSVLSSIISLYKEAWDGGLLYLEVK